MELFAKGIAALYVSMFFSAMALIVCQATILPSSCSSNGSQIILYWMETFFTYTCKRPLITSDPPTNFTYLAVSANPPHTDTPAAELLFLTYCIIEVGFVDTTNKLFTQRLQADYIFVFPKRLVQCQFIWAENDSRIVVVSGNPCGLAETATVVEAYYTPVKPKSRPR
ncbi:hypothetical protein CXB51_015543 [Gossypium anomalum]|uniref:Cupin type-1 domain-containing protein n=1 Tax=Gossypium anomalum TaxID=47600 RepID=A0A8J6CZ85_9ROSI|nr:hypothetical protein CXB51_015543 [Gossypium anomalum]